MKILPIIFLSLFLFSCQEKKEKSEGKETKSSSELDADKNFTNRKMTTYYFIRHSEKDRSAETNDPHLLPKGMERAKQWAEILANKNIEVVYSTNYQRTLETARPTAEKANLKIELYEPSQVYSKEFQNKTAGKTSLIVGHSDTTPQFINKILGKKKYKDIPDNENGNLYKVIIHPNGRVESSVENYPLKKS
jgi:broad specificity phosphatase PhoE